MLRTLLLFVNEKKSFDWSLKWFGNDVMKLILRFYGNFSG